MLNKYNHTYAPERGLYLSSVDRKYPQNNEQEKGLDVLPATLNRGLVSSLHRVKKKQNFNLFETEPFSWIII